MEGEYMIILKQRNELLHALENIIHLHGCEQEGISTGQPTPQQWFEAVNEASSIINKIKTIKN